MLLAFGPAIHAIDEDIPLDRRACGWLRGARHVHHLLHAGAIEPFDLVSKP
jgi:hypothetical protein